MTVNYKIIRKRIRTLWPKCRNVWLRDSEYEYPKIEEIEYVITNDYTDKMVSRGARFDCDDFALQLAAAVSSYRATNVEGDEPRPWPFGQAMVRKHRGRVEKHNLNICLLEDRIVLIEPQDDKIWTGSPTEDSPFFVIMP